MAISNSDGEGRGLNVVVRSWLKDNCGRGFTGMGGRLMKEGVDGVLCQAVRCVCVDETVLNVLVILLYVEASRKCVCVLAFCRWMRRKKVWDELRWSCRGPSFGLLARGVWGDQARGLLGRWDAE